MTGLKHFSAAAVLATLALLPSQVQAITDIDLPRLQKMIVDRLSK